MKKEEKIDVKTLLIKAVKIGHTNSIIDILKSNPCTSWWMSSHNRSLINTVSLEKEDKGKQLLHLAAYYGHLETIKLLRDEKLQAQQGIDQTAKAETAGTCDERWYATHAAIEGNSLNAAQILDYFFTETPRKVNEQVNGWNYLHYAAKFSTQKNVLQYLLTKDIDINAKTACQADITALQIAVSSNNQMAIEILVENGADLCVFQKKYVSNCYGIEVKNVIPLLASIFTKNQSGINELLKKNLSNQIELVVQTCLSLDNFSIKRECAVIKLTSCPTREIIDDRAINIISAYLRFEDRLFYMDRVSKEFYEINIDQKSLNLLDKSLNSDKSIKMLDDEMIIDISVLANHTHVENNNPYGTYECDWILTIDALQFLLKFPDKRIVELTIDSILKFSEAISDGRTLTALKMILPVILTTLDIEKFVAKKIINLYLTTDIINWKNDLCENIISAFTLIETFEIFFKALVNNRSNISIRSYLQRAIHKFQLTEDNVRYLLEIDINNFKTGDMSILHTIVSMLANSLLVLKKSSMVKPVIDKLINIAKLTSDESLKEKIIVTLSNTVTAHGMTEEISKYFIQDFVLLCPIFKNSIIYERDLEKLKRAGLNNAVIMAMLGTQESVQYFLSFRNTYNEAWDKIHSSQEWTVVDDASKDDLSHKFIENLSNPIGILELANKAASATHLKEFLESLIIIKAPTLLFEAVLSYNGIDPATSLLLNLIEDSLKKPDSVTEDTPALLSKLLLILSNKNRNEKEKLDQKLYDRIASLLLNDDLLNVIVPKILNYWLKVGLISQKGKEIKEMLLLLSGMKTTIPAVHFIKLVKDNFEREDNLAIITVNSDKSVVNGATHLPNDSDFNTLDSKKIACDHISYLLTKIITDQTDDVDQKFHVVTTIPAEKVDSSSTGMASTAGNKIKLDEIIYGMLNFLKHIKYKDYWEYVIKFLTNITAIESIDPEIKSKICSELLTKISTLQDEKLVKIALSGLSSLQDDKIINKITDFINNATDDIRFLIIKYLPGSNIKNFLMFLKDFIINDNVKLEVRIAAMQRLSEYPDSQVIDYLKSICMHQSESIDIEFRKKALSVLGYTKSNDGATVLVEFLKHPEKIRDPNESLQLYPRERQQKSKRDIIIKALKVVDSKEVIDKIILIFNTDFNLKQEIKHFFREFYTKKRDIITLMVNQLKTNWLAADLLRLLEDSVVMNITACLDNIPCLLDHLNNKSHLDKNDRLLIVFKNILQNLLDKRDIDSLIKIYKLASAHVKIIVESYLSNLDSKLVIEEFVVILTHKEDLKNRNACSESMIRMSLINDPYLIDQLIKILSDVECIYDWYAKDAAVNLLSQSSNSTAIDYLFDGIQHYFNKEILTNVILTLARSKDRFILKRLFNLQDIEEEEIKNLITEALSQVQTEEGLKLLIELMEEKATSSDISNHPLRIRLLQNLPDSLPEMDKTTTLINRLKNNLGKIPTGNQAISFPSISLELTIPSHEVKFIFNDRSKKSKLGEGGFSKVYHGEWRYLPVAVKKLRGKVKEEEKQLGTYFSQEAIIMTCVKSPYIVRLYGLFLLGESPCLVLEYMSCGSLFDYIHSKNRALPLDDDRKIQIARDIAYGVFALHEENIIHRDLKSPNVLLDEELRAKVTDFGLAKMKTPGRDSSIVGTAAGTTRWMAPEVIRNKPASKKSDVYSYGMILWELCAEEEPLPQYKDDESIRTSLSNERLSRIPLAIPDNPSKLANLIKSCWAMNPQHRPTMDQIVSEEFRIIATPKLSTKEAYEEEKSLSLSSGSFSDDI